MFKIVIAGIALVVNFPKVKDQAHEMVAHSSSIVAVSGMVSQFDRNTESYNVRGVPAFLVNGKYMVKIESITSQEQFNQLVKFLLAKKD
mgnify:CR=1 FL=1